MGVEEEGKRKVKKGWRFTDANITTGKRYFEQVVKIPTLKSGEEPPLEGPEPAVSQPDALREKAHRAAEKFDKAGQPTGGAPND